MSRRRPPAELQFGSDSFLDVVANIVGILIILIVIAGLRMGKMPVVMKTAPTDAAAPTIPIVPVPASTVPQLADAEPAEETSTEPRVLVLQPVEEAAEPEIETPPLPELVAPQELVDRTKRLEAEISAIQTEESAVTARLRQAGIHQSTLLERQRAVENTLSEKTLELDATRKKALHLVADLELARETLARLTQQVKDLEEVPDRVETLEHRITPISRSVSGSEKHYRLERNRVVEVPIEDLVFRFREQLERRKEWLVKSRQPSGEIGPIKGFKMQYLLRIDTYSELDAARMGHSGFRISLARWEVIPEPETKGESAEVALRKGSQFYQSILGTTPDTTLTFWIYPDSFGLYHKIQTFAHEHGFSVAGRPLPQGQHIAGSPEGSASASQ